MTTSQKVTGPSPPVQAKWAECIGSNLFCQGFLAGFRKVFGGVYLGKPGSFSGSGRKKAVNWNQGSAKNSSPLGNDRAAVFQAINPLTTAGTPARGPTAKADIGGNTEARPAPLVYVVHFYLFGLFL
jgi:hypothetical protein